VAIEEYPYCGASLADTLTTATTKQQQRTIIEHKKLPAPKIQTAYDLLNAQFKFDIPKIDSFLQLATSGLLFIVGYKEANLILARLCVRALLPVKYGGLDSPYVLVIDAGNKSDIYQTVNFARQYGMDFRQVLNRIIVTRTVPCIN
jgi:hypothetical protein